MRRTIPQMRRTGALCLICAALVSGICAAVEPSPNLPKPIALALARSQLPQQSVGLWIARAGETRPLVALNADRLYEPASIMKTVTTMAGLEILSPAYTWTTTVTARSGIRNHSVQGLGIRGTGDPHLVIERVWLIAERLAGLGVKRIDGDMVIDRSIFAEQITDQGAFDGAATRTYNVGPDAALINLKTVSVSFLPDAQGRWARVSVLPRLAGVRFPERVPIVRSACADWKKTLRADLRNSTNIRFAGAYPSACPAQQWHMSLWDADDYVTRVFAQVFAQTGGVWKGHARQGQIAANEPVLLQEDSPPLSQIVTYINKFSNNPMARHLFLTLAFSDALGMNEPATLARSRAVVARWLQNKGIDPRDIVIDNGSGLSRSAQVTPAALGKLLSLGFISPTMPEFVSSLPLAGVDGTMKKRRLLKGSAHVKTGYLHNVRSIAGYVTDTSGQRWSVVFVVNHPRPDSAKALGDAVLAWCADEDRTF